MSLIHRIPIIPALVLSLFIFTKGKAQVVGNPIEQIEQKELGMGLALESIHRHMGEGNMTSQRLWMKATYGIADWWTASAIGGGGNLYFNPEPGAAITTFRGSFEWGYGGMTKLTLLRGGPVEFFGFGAGLRVFSSGTVYFASEDRTVDLRYDWQEYFGGGGLSYYGDRWLLYGGMEERMVRWHETGSKIKNVSKTEPNVFMGFEYHVRGTLNLNMQFKFLNEYSFVLGISEHNFLKFD